MQVSGATREAVVLLVEDDPVIALDTSMTLQSIGATVVEMATTLDEAQKLLDKIKPQIVVLDIDLRGVMSFTLAERLVQDSIPFIFTTGYGSELTLPPAFRDRPVVGKPYDVEELRQALLPHLEP